MARCDRGATPRANPFWVGCVTAVRLCCCAPVRAALARGGARGGSASRLGRAGFVLSSLVSTPLSTVCDRCCVGLM